MIQVQLSVVTKSYDDIVAVEEIDLTVRDGEFLVVAGPSGCGKSTTLRMVAWLETISGGEIDIGSEIVSDISPQNRDIAMVFQNYALYPHMSVRENMFFRPCLSGEYGRDIVDDRVESAAELLEIPELLDQYPKELSGGQQQRVALGRAIVRDLEVFLMDESLSNLDAKLRSQMYTELQRLHEELGVTTVCVTHGQTKAMTMGDRIAILKHGELQQVAEPDVCYDEPNDRFVAGFIGSPSMNFFEVVVESISDGVAVEGESFGTDLDVPLATGRYTLGVRQEDLRLVDGADRILADVDIVEPMGADNYPYLNPPTNDGFEKEIVARVDSTFHPEPGERVALDFDAEDVHLFNETGKQVPTA